MKLMNFLKVEYSVALSNRGGRGGYEKENEREVR